MTEPAAVIAQIIITCIALGLVCGIAIGYPWGYYRSQKLNMEKLNTILNKYKNRI